MLIAVDTGGTKTLVAGFSKDGRIEESVAFATPQDAATYVKELIATIKSITGDSPVDGIAIAMPGFIRNDIVVWCGNLPWKNFDIKAKLAPHFKGIPLLLENDSHLGGLGEARMLKNPPHRLLYVTISTGIGLGLVVDGKIAQDIRPSEGGHAVVEYNGILQEWEDFASGKAVFDTYGKYAKDIHNKQIWYEIAKRISRGFLAHLPLLQPDVVIIGGSMGTHFRRYDEQLLGILKESLPPKIPCPTFVAASHPEQAVIYGCYFHAVDNLPRLSA